jgi:two-component system, response regulator PdtaR
MVPAGVIGLRVDKPVILAVEDEVLLRMHLCDRLRDAGFTVVEAGDASEALRVLKARSDVALVVTDLRMPGDMDGNDLVREIHKMYPDVKVISASAHQIDEPVTASVSKPYNVDDLIALIRSLLD